MAHQVTCKLAAKSIHPHDPKPLMPVLSNHLEPVSQPRMIYVDPAVLEATLADRPNTTRAVSRVICIEDQLRPLRRNVHDSARAVLQWLAATMAPDSNVDLNEILGRCLRPGTDLARLNYAAMAREIKLILGVELSPKRVRTAIEHLRCQQIQDPPQRELRRKLDELAKRLERNHHNLIAANNIKRAVLRRALGTDLLAAVRSAVSRLIDHGFGEGIPEHVNLDELGGRYRSFVRQTFREQKTCSGSLSLSRDLRRLLVTLSEYEEHAESDMCLVMDGVRVICNLMGPGSLVGILARLNLLVAGRNLIHTKLYVGQMHHLAESAAALHGDAATRSYVNWVRRLPKDARVPSPLRVASYCLNNAATRILERCYAGELEGGHWLAMASGSLATMRERDAGFRLLKVTEAIYHTVVSGINADTRELEAYFRELGTDKTVALIVDLARFDNNPTIVDAVRQQAARILPEVANQIIHVQ